MTQHHHIHRRNDDALGVLYIAGPIRDHSRLIRNALDKALGEGQIDVLEHWEGCNRACEDRIEAVLRHHRIDVIVAPYAAYKRITNMRLGHLFVDLEALLFGGEAGAEIFSACPGKFGIAGNRRIDSGLPSSAVDSVQNPFGGIPGMGGDVGRSGAISIMLGEFGARMNYRNLLGAGEALPQFHLGSNVAAGGGTEKGPASESVRIGETVYQVSLTTNQYGGHDYVQRSESGGHVSCFSTDAAGDVKETTETEVYWAGDRITAITHTKDDRGITKEKHIVSSPAPNTREDKTDDKPQKEQQQEPDDTGKDVRSAVRRFVERMMLQQLWEAMLSGRLPAEPTDVTREFLGWVTQQKVTDFCHLFEAELKEKDETGYAWAHWVSQTIGTRHVRASKFWEYLWSTGAPIDPVGAVAYGSRIATVGGRVDQETGEVTLAFHRTGVTSG